jgi:flagellar hook-associated protein 3 FlgL
MRVTQNTNFETVRSSINKSKGRMENLQMQSATLKKLNAPSDDPIGAAKVLSVRTEKVNVDQYQTNAKLAEGMLSSAETALGELADIAVRAKEIAIGQSSGASANDDTRLGIAEEVGQLFQQAVAAANTRVGDRYIFGGYKIHKPPVSGEGQYTGDDGQVMLEIANDVFVTANIPGIDAFNTRPKSSNDQKLLQQQKEQDREVLELIGRAPSSTGERGEGISNGDHVETNGTVGDLENVNVFDELQNLRISLLTGDTDGVRGSLDRLDEIHAKLVASRAKVGSRMQGIQSTLQALERHSLTNAQLTSTIEDADMAQVVSELAKEETIFRSALGSSQKLIQPTLLDFLK